MPVIISDKDHKFRGTFSGWSTVWQALKTLQRAKNDEQVERDLLILADDGRIKIGDRSYCRCSRSALTHELNKQARVNVFDTDDQSHRYTLWLSPIDEIFEVKSGGKTSGK